MKLTLKSIKESNFDEMVKYQLEIVTRHFKSTKFDITTWECKLTDRTILHICKGRYVYNITFNASRFSLEKIIGNINFIKQNEVVYSNKDMHDELITILKKLDDIFKEEYGHIFDAQELGLL